MLQWGKINNEVGTEFHSAYSACDANWQVDT